MKKITKYLLWLPFAVSIGSFLLYFVYAIRIKIDNTTVTSSIQSSLKSYLIIGSIALFIGLLFVFIQKLIILLKDDNTDVVNISKSKSNEYILRIINPVFNNGTITGKISETNEDVTVYIGKSLKEASHSLPIDKINCPECNNIISKEAGICPYCGIIFDKKITDLIKKNEKKLKKNNKKFSLKKFILDILVILLFIFLIFLVVNLLINKQSQNYNNISGNNKKVSILY